jgi:hypothetical protein
MPAYWPGGVRGPVRGRGRSRSEALAVVAIWLGTRLGVIAVAAYASATIVRGSLQEPFLDRWTQWDVGHLIEIAQYGYAGTPGKPRDGGLIGFFPGFPLLLRGVHVVVPDWRLAALLISLVAGAFAMVALTRLADRESGHGTGIFATVAMLLSPFAVFLFAGYSEALFLAFAFPAWASARRRDWRTAGLCGLAAGTVRITGLFLGIALVLEFLLVARPDVAKPDVARPDGVDGRRWRDLAWLALPFAGVVTYFGYLWWWSGDALAWQHAQADHWGRKTTNPVDAFKTTWQAAFGTHDMFTDAFRVELAAAAIGVALTIWLIAKRRWPEAVYVGLQMAAFLTSSYYLSIGRATLLWWPLWVLIGGLGVRGGRGDRAYGLRLCAYVALLTVLVPLLVVQIVHFTEGAWAG